MVRAWRADAWFCMILLRFAHDSVEILHDSETLSLILLRFGVGGFSDNDQEVTVNHARRTSTMIWIIKLQFYENRTQHFPVIPFKSFRWKSRQLFSNSCRGIHGQKRPIAASLDRIVAPLITPNNRCWTQMMLLYHVPLRVENYVCECVGGADRHLCVVSAVKNTVVVVLFYVWLLFCCWCWLSKYFFAVDNNIVVDIVDIVVAVVVGEVVVVHEWTLETERGWGGIEDKELLLLCNHEQYGEWS